MIFRRFQDSKQENENLFAKPVVLTPGESSTTLRKASFICVMMMMMMMTGEEVQH
jgi:hypothetical protein